jgi:beta-lactamase class C
MRNKALPIVVLFVAWASVVSGRRVAFAQEREGEEPLRQIVESIIQPWHERYRPPGTIVVIRQAGKTYFFPFGEANRARGVPVTAESIFELASVTKVFTTTSLALEVEEGRMRLDDPVDKYLPRLREGRSIRRVTLEQLATHTSSLPRVPTGRPRHPWDRRLVIDWLMEWEAPYPPGTKSLYSNLALGVLGYAIAEHEREPLERVWKRQFLEPLGMNHTFFEIPEPDRHLVVQGYGQNGEPVPHDPPGGWPAGGRLSSSGRDMAEFLVANLGEREDRPAITKAMQFAQRPFFKVSEHMVQGLCWQRVPLQGHLVIDKNGGLDGTSTYIGMIPEQHLGVVVMANKGKCQGTSVGRHLLLKLVGVEKEEPLPPADENSAEDEFEPAP